jgi:hypothetical protein
MGYKTNDFYHSTTNDFDAFDFSRLGSGGASVDEPAVFLSSKPGVTDEYIAHPWVRNTDEVKRQFGDQGGEVVRVYHEGGLLSILAQT